MRSAVAGANGEVVLPALLPGRYEVRIEAPPVTPLQVAPEVRAVEVRVVAGGEVDLDVALPYREREVRYSPLHGRLPGR